MTRYGLAGFNALSNFDRAYGHEFGRDGAMPIGLLKLLRVARLPGDLMPALPAGRMDDQVGHLSPVPINSFAGAPGKMTTIPLIEKNAAAPARATAAVRRLDRWWRFFRAST